MITNRISQMAPVLQRRATEAENTASTETVWRWFNRNEFSWDVAQRITNIPQDKFFLKHVITRAPKELSYVEKSAYTKDVGN